MDIAGTLGIEAEVAGKEHQYAPIAHKVVCVDFDNTLFPWGEFFEVDAQPMPGAVDALKAFREAGFSIVIFSSRMSPRWLQSANQSGSRHTEYIIDCLTRHDMPWDALTAEKIPAMAYIDDKAIEFTPKSPNWEQIVKRLVKTGEQKKRRA